MFGLRREPLILLDYYKKIDFLIYIKVSKENKVGWHNPQRIRRPDVTRQMPHIVLNPVDLFGDLHRRCHSYVQIMHVDMCLIYDDQLVSL